MKYNNKLTLTNPKSVPFALCNNFDNTFELIDKVIECKSAKEFCTVANNMHRYGRTWILDKDCDSETRLRSTDPFGNIEYLMDYFERYDYKALDSVEELNEYQGNYGFNIFDKRYHILYDDALDVWY